MFQFLGKSNTSGTGSHHCIPRAQFSARLAKTGTGSDRDEVYSMSQRLPHSPPTHATHQARTTDHSHLLWKYTSHVVVQLVNGVYLHIKGLLRCWFTS